MRADYHIHSYYSDDSEYRMEDVVKDAIKMGLDEICFTEHVDFGVKKTMPFKDIPILQKAWRNCDAQAFHKELTTLQQKYNNQISIKMGVELGMQKHTIMENKEYFDKYNYDFALLSCHQIEDKELWTGEYQKGKSLAEVNEGYYKEILTVINNYHDYSVLAHLDHVRRYMDRDGYGIDSCRNIIKEILIKVISDGKGIEVNTSHDRYQIGDFTPSKEILQMYHQLGGKIITIGSDTHKSEDLGYYIEEMKAELVKIGFEEYCTFEQMKPIFHSLKEN